MSPTPRCAPAAIHQSSGGTTPAGITVGGASAPIRAGVVRPTIALLLALALAGCSLLTSRRSEFTIYGIELAPQRVPGAPVEWQLAIDEPVAADPVRSTRIVLKPGDRAYGVYKGARWTDRAPTLVQALLIEAFEGSGRIIGLGRSSSSIRGDFALTTELRAFEARYDGGAATVHVELSAKLSRGSSNDVVAARVFEADAVAAGRDVASVVPAFEEALGEVVGALVPWTLEAGNASWAERAEPETAR